MVALCHAWLVDVATRGVADVATRGLNVSALLWPCVAEENTSSGHAWARQLASEKDPATVQAERACS